MAWYYQFCCVLSLAFISKTNGGTLGRPSHIDNNPSNFYQNNPFLKNLSFATTERYQYYNYGRPNYQNLYQNQNSNPYNHFMDNHSDNRFIESPKITMRRDVAEEEVPNYPYEEIRQYLKQNPLLQMYFTQVPQLGNRGGPSDEALDEGESLCKMQVIRTYYPKKLKNINNIEKVVVNDEKDYKQAVEQTRCANTGQCNIPFDAFGYTSSCHQNFDSKRLMVYENSTKQIVFDEFRVPSCCVCKIKKVR